jgi:hypothetical protein
LEAIMLQEKDAVATVAVANLASARKFYAETLELMVLGGEGNEVIVFKSGKSTINVYWSQYAGTNKAAALTRVVGDELENVARALKAEGVKFVHYELPGRRLKWRSSKQGRWRYKRIAYHT